MIDKCGTKGLTVGMSSGSWRVMSVVGENKVEIVSV